MIVSYQLVVGLQRNARFSLNNSFCGDINEDILGAVDHSASTSRGLAYTILGCELLIFLFNEFLVVEWLP